MARTRYGTDRGLTTRMFGTLFGLGLLYVVLAAALYALGFSAILILGLSGALLFGQWWFSDTLSMKAMRAVEVTPEQAPQLHAVVDRLCAMADMPKPRVGIADSEAPNAFATGRSPNRSVVVVTTGLLRRLNRDELEGVLAHELSHVAHRDVTVMTVASFTAILAGFMVRSAMWGSMMRGRRDQSTALVFVGVMVVSVIVSLVESHSSTLSLKVTFLQLLLPELSLSLSSAISSSCELLPAASIPMYPQSCRVFPMLGSSELPALSPV